MPNNSTVQVAIIGSGPAGIAAAVQLKRYAINFILFDSVTNGSLLRNAHRVENYLGFPQGISGIELLRVFHQQLAENNIVPIQQKAAAADYLVTENLFKINTAENNYFAEYLIVAAGTKPKTEPLLEELAASGQCKINYEVYDFLTAKNKKFAILGAGDAAFDYALSLLANNQVTVFNRGAEIKALPCLCEAAFQHENFKYYPNANLPKIMIAKNEYDHLLLALGRTPQKEFYTNNLERLEQKLLESGLLYLIGDVKNDIYRQTAIAAGDGIKAAMQIVKGNELWQSK
jgi:thioredoxin reductase (NADPH)